MTENAAIALIVLACLAVALTLILTGHGVWVFILGWIGFLCWSDR